MPATAQAFNVTDDYRDRLDRLSAGVQAHAKRAWRQMKWDDLRASFEHVVTSVVPVVSQAQVEAVRLTSAYLAAFLTAETGEPTMPPIIVRDKYIGSSYGGQPLQYSLRSALVTVLAANKRRDEDPLGQGLRALLVNIDLDVKEAARSALHDAIVNDPRIVGWRRAVGGTCAACLAAADGTKKPGEPLKVHPNCKCVAEPVVDPGRVVQPAPEMVVGPRAREDARRRYEQEKPPGVHADKGDLADDYLALYYELPEDLRGALDAYPKCVNISSRPVTYAFPAMREKRGMTPRGWPEGLTYDDCPGFYSRPTGIARHKVYLGRGLLHREGSLAHEVGHLIDDHLRERNDTTAGLIHTSELSDWHEKLYGKLLPYQKQGGPRGNAGVREFFAEAIADLMQGHSVAVERYGRNFIDWLEKQIRDFITISHDADETAKWKPQRRTRVAA